MDRPAPAVAPAGRRHRIDQKKVMAALFLRDADAAPTMRPRAAAPSS
ncbi:MAG: hypothetical protein ACKO91_09455 [Acidimicrobiales bacterium]